MRIQVADIATLRLFVSSQMAGPVMDPIGPPAPPNGHLAEIVTVFGVGLSLT